MTWLILGITVGILLWQESFPPREYTALLNLFGLTPATTPLGRPGGTDMASFVTYNFFHGGLWHAASNLWLFWIFAPVIEDLTGPVRFLLVYLACGILAGVSHVLVNPASNIPVVGASGAISGVLGGFFVLYPHARISTFVFFFFLRLPAAAYLGGWFLLQLYYGLNAGSDGVAWWAHLGGFAAGMILFPLFFNRSKVQLQTTAPTQGPGQRPSHHSDSWSALRSQT